eukprot:TRINITY_DN104866_c0_g1_i1.p1 TRINITY_DN104866_c0_g1~~TRINITY_DN104866_c0_g1_i1.p1  ORF type:complete len:219 (-),score=28.27 TRINITY_DN104866_c0_g1_i1:413-1069(-)
MACISCHCEKTRVMFATPKPVYALDCFCVDCYQKNAHFSKLSGVPLPEALTSQGKLKPVLLNYFPGKMIVIGEEHLSFNKIRHDSGSTNCCTTCCNSLLFVDHDFYQGQIVLMMPEFRPISNGATMEPVGRVHIKDWPEEEYNKYDQSARHLPASYNKNGKSVTTGAFKPAFAEAIKEAREILDFSDEGKTFAQLLRDSGGRVEVLGLAELPGSGKFK